MSPQMDVFIIGALLIWFIGTGRARHVIDAVK